MSVWFRLDSCLQMYYTSTSRYTNLMGRGSGIQMLWSEPVIFIAFPNIPRLPDPFKPEFPIVIFIHYKPRISVAILDL